MKRRGCTDGSNVGKITLISISIMDEERARKRVKGYVRERLIFDQTHGDLRHREKRLKWGD